MLARKLGQLLLWTGVTLSAVVLQARSHEHLFWCMGISVAGGAINHYLAVRGIMATGAFGHQCIEVPFFRVVGVDDRVALLAIKLVPGAITPQAFVVTRVALPALARRQRHGISRIECRIRGDCYRGNRRLFLGPQSNGRDQYQSRRQQQPVQFL